MIRDPEFESEALGKLIASDSVGRNQYLDSFIGALNSVEKSIYISVDAPWGAGKTVFMKQIEYLNTCSISELRAPDISENVIDTFQDKFIVFYYNAWENDYHVEPLQSLLFNLIEQFYGDHKKQEKAKALASGAAKSIAKEAVKSLTKGIVDIEKLSKVESIDDLVSNISVANERKKAVSDITAKILPEGKKILFIIDELDRCNPEFAVRLMEIVKHYYNEDNLAFILSTNNRQLVHTVKKYYGDGFDGYGYLNKFYDLNFELPSVDIERYLRNQLAVPDDGYWVNIIPVEIAKHLQMTMREANRYTALFSFIKGRIRNGERWYSSKLAPLLTYYVFIPLALALKVRNIDLYDKFISGNGEMIIRELYASDDIFSRLITKSEENSELQPADMAVAAYKEMVGANKLPYDQAHYDTLQANRFFKEVLPLIASVKNIDSEEKSS